MKPPRECRMGFSLLEVMIAVLVFVMAVASILPLFAVGTTAHRRAIDQTEAALLAARIAARLQENFTEVNPKNLVNATVEEGGTFYTYDAEFFPFEKLDPARSAFLARVRVKWTVAGTEHAETFETVLLRKIRR